MSSPPPHTHMKLLSKNEGLNENYTTPLKFKCSKGVLIRALLRIKIIYNSGIDSPSVDSLVDEGP